tara:strand:+ start:3938 stop:4519 length:582 start_codon:yes stop_codon:yes gene_type:complete
MDIVVKDNFLKNPHEYRNFALKNRDKFITQVNGDWPGYRYEVTDVFPQENIRKLMPEPVTLSLSAFYSIGKEWQSGVCHFDRTKYTSILYLSPEAPENSGTEIYDHNRINLNEYYQGNKRSKYYLSNKNYFDKLRFNRWLKKWNNKFGQGEPIVISNKFNRLMIYESQRIHRAQDYFGSTIKDSRLILISFWK